MLPRRIFLAGSILSLLCVCVIPLGVAAADPDPAGVWATAGGLSHIKIAHCGTNLCGNIVWLKQPLNRYGKDKVDSNNPDPSLRTRTIVSLPLLSGFEQSQDDTSSWSNGKIYDPANGKTYSCNLTVEDRSTLHLRGYIGFSLFGQTQTWTRVADNKGGSTTP